MCDPEMSDTKLSVVQVTTHSLQVLRVGYETPGEVTIVNDWYSLKRSNHCSVWMFMWQLLTLKTLSNILYIDAQNNSYTMATYFDMYSLHPEYFYSDAHKNTHVS